MRLAKRVDDGTPILGLEPSCLLTLADEWPDLMPGSDARRVAAAADLADGWLAKQVAAGKTSAEINTYLSQFDKWDRYDYDGDGNFNEPDGYH